MSESSSPASLELARRLLSLCGAGDRAVYRMVDRAIVSGDARDQGIARACYRRYLALRFKEFRSMNQAPQPETPEELRTDVDQLIADDPDGAAQVLRKWMR